MEDKRKYCEEDNLRGKVYTEKYKLLNFSYEEFTSFFDNNDMSAVDPILNDLSESLDVITEDPDNQEAADKSLQLIKDLRSKMEEIGFQFKE
jgi:hypothetical protein